MHSNRGMTSYVDILAAFREDLARRDTESFGPVEGSWVQLGVLLAHAAILTEDPRLETLKAAAQVARELLGPAKWAEGNRLDPSPPADINSLDARIRSITEAIEDEGALRLADGILATFLVAHPSCEPLEVGRIEVARARVAWKMGELDVARDRIARALAIAETINSDELRVRATIGEALLARLTGNYPLSEATATAALIVAQQAQLPRLAGLAHHAIMVAAAVRGRYQDAVAHGWTGFIAASGDEVLQSEFLGNIGQLFLDLGHPGTAIAAFEVVVQHNAPSRLLLPALGGLAIAAARRGDASTLNRTAQRIEVLSRTAGTPYTIACGLLELAEAHRTLGDEGEMQRHLVEVSRLAALHGYNELAYRAEHFIPVAAPERQALVPYSEAVADAVRQLVRV